MNNNQMLDIKKGALHSMALNSREKEKERKKGMSIGNMSERVNDQEIPRENSVTTAKVCSPFQKAEVDLVADQIQCFYRWGIQFASLRSPEDRSLCFKLDNWFLQIVMSRSLNTPNTLPAFPLIFPELTQVIIWGFRKLDAEKFTEEEWQIFLPLLDLIPESILQAIALEI